MSCVDGAGDVGGRCELAEGIGRDGMGTVDRAVELVWRSK